MRSFNHIAQLIKESRLKHPRRYSQSELSHALGYRNGQFISNVERGLCSIPLKGIGNVAEILDINVEEVKAAILKDYEATLNYYLNDKIEGKRKIFTKELVI